MKTLITEKPDSRTLHFKSEYLNGQKITFPITPTDDIQQVLKHLIYTYHEIGSYFQRPDFFTDSPLIIDCGAYPGEFTVLASRFAKKSQIIALEPSKPNFSYLNKVLKSNKLGNVEHIFTLRGGVGAKPENTFISSDRAMSTIGPIGEPVEITTIDHLVEKLNPRGNKEILIKMDIEGHEIPALLGTTKTIKRFKPDLMVASYHQVNGCVQTPEVEKLLKNLGYRYVETLYPDHPVTYASMRKPFNGALIPLFYRLP